MEAEAGKIYRGFLKFKTSDYIRLKDIGSYVRFLERGWKVWEVFLKCSDRVRGKRRKNLEWTISLREINKDIKIWAKMGIPEEFKQ